MKNDIGFYLGDEDRIKGGNLVYLPYTHSVLTRGNSHRILISDQQLLQWYSRRQDIRHSPLPYCIVKTAVLDLLSDRITPAGDDNSAPILITPLTDSTDTIILPTQPAVIQHLETTTAHTPPNPTVPAPRLILPYPVQRPAGTQQLAANVFRTTYPP